MALDIEIGGATSDSYGTLAAYTAYSTALGRTLAATEAENEVNLRKGALFLDRKFDFIGSQQYQYQALSWPRLVRDLVDDFPVNPDTIPEDIKKAQFEMAFIFQGGLDPLATIETSTTGESIKVGPITIASDNLPTSTPRIVAVEGLLRQYIIGGAGQISLRRG